LFVFSALQLSCTPGTNTTDELQCVEKKHICSLHAKMWKTNQFYFKRYNKNQNKFSKPLVFFNKIKKKVLPPKKIKQTNKQKTKIKKTLPAKKMIFLRLFPFRIVSDNHTYVQWGIIFSSFCPLVRYSFIAKFTTKISSSCLILIILYRKLSVRNIQTLVWFKLPS
jgi:hypothetical protein